MATFTGDAGDDTYTGTPDADSIAGGDGNDTLNGGDGDDIITGGAGDDEIDGGAGFDVVHAGAGNDDFNLGTGGGDLVYGEDGSDFFYASPVSVISVGSAVYDGGDGNDTFFLSWIEDYTAFGGDGGDVFRVSRGAGISLIGGAGNDEFALRTSTGTVDAGSGNDYIRLENGTYTITLGAGQDYVNVSEPVGGTTTFTDFTPGEQGDTLDLLYLFGANALQPGGRLTISQEGADAVIADSQSDARYVFLNVLAADLTSNLHIGNPLANPPDRIIEDEHPDPDNAATLTGFDGDDVIRGFGGDDYLIGAGGNDTLEGGDGNDVLHTSIDDDVLDGGSGIDTAIFRLPGRAIADLRIAGAQDTGWGSFALIGIENLVGNGLADELTGDAGANRLDGSGGADRLAGGLGDDVLVVDDAGDVVVETAGQGWDTVEASLSWSLARSHVEGLRLTGTGDFNGAGNGLENTIWGNSGANTLRGGAGSDHLLGSVGNDVYFVDDPGDTVLELVNEGADRVSSSIDFALSANVENLLLTGAARIGRGNGGVNTIFGSDGSDKLVGLGGGDILRGKIGGDALSGGNGNDLLDGGLGKDTLAGGAGGDRFQFRDGDMQATRDASDVIADFNRAESDTIELNLVDANTAAGGDQAFAFIGDNAFTGTAGQLRYVHASGNTYLEGDTNGDGTADFMIALTGLHALVETDFVL